MLSLFPYAYSYTPIQLNTHPHTFTHTFTYNLWSATGKRLKDGSPHFQTHAAGGQKLPVKGNLKVFANITLLFRKAQLCKQFKVCTLLNPYP